MGNEFFSNALITAGWLQPLTLANRHRVMQTIIVYDVLMKRKATLDQFIKGLETLGVHQLIKSSPELMKQHFVNTTGPLKSDDLIKSLKFPENDENRLAKEFLIQSIMELENVLYIQYIENVHFQISRAFIIFLGFTTCKLLLSRAWFFWAGKVSTLHDIT
jgi:hypothetical protein